MNQKPSGMYLEVGISPPERGTTRTFKRDATLQSLRRLFPELRETYGVRLAASSERPELIIVHISSEQGVDLDSLQTRLRTKLLGPGKYTLRWVYSGNNTGVPLESMEELAQLRETQAVLRGDIATARAATLRSEEERKGLAVMLDTKTREMREKEDRFARSFSGFRSEILHLKESLIDPSNLTREELTVLNVRQLDRGNYLDAAIRYEEQFPHGLEEKHLEFFRQSLKDFALAPIFRDRIAPLAALDLSAPLEEILVEARAKASPFEETSFYNENVMQYEGAKRLMDTKGPIKLLNEAREVVERFERARVEWEERRTAASDSVKYLEGRIAHYKRKGSSDIVVPIVFDASYDGRMKSMVIAFPTNEATKDAGLTIDLQRYLAESVKGAIEDIKGSESRDDEIMGSTVITIRTPIARNKANERNSLYDLVARIKANYETLPLHRFGVQIRPIVIGEVL